jgi:NAD+ synthase (glutamine-hydrolysing)
VHELFVTCYLGTINSSIVTNSRAKRLAEGIGALHYEVGIDDIYASVIVAF